MKTRNLLLIIVMFAMALSLFLMSALTYAQDSAPLMEPNESVTANQSEEICVNVEPDQQPCEEDPEAESEPEAPLDLTIQKRLNLESGVAVPTSAPSILSESDLSAAILSESDADTVTLGSAHPYLPNTLQIVKVTRSGALKMMIRFSSDFDLEAGYDTFGIYVFDEALNGFALLDGTSYSGTELADKMLEIYGESVIFRFSSDENIESYGWHLVEVRPVFPDDTEQPAEETDDLAQTSDPSETSHQEEIQIPTSIATIDSTTGITPISTITPTPPLVSDFSLATNVTIEPEIGIIQNDYFFGQSDDVQPKALSAPKLTISLDQSDGVEPYIRLNWTSIPGATSYRVWRSTNPSTGFIAYWDWPYTSIGFPYCPRDVTYYYKVSAVQNNVDGPFSNTVGGRARIEKPVIETPIKVGSSHVRLIWDPILGATGYRIWRSETSLSSGYNWVITIGNLNEIITAVPSPSKKYYYKVAAIVVDMVGPLSDPVLFQEVSLIKPTINPISRVTANSLRVSWNEIPGATGYRVWRSLSPNSGYNTVWNLGSNMTSMITNVPDTRRFYYKVAALANNVIGPLSDPVAGTTALPSPTLKPIINGSNGHFGLYWTAVPGAVNYRIYRSEIAPTHGFSWVNNVGNRTSIATKVPDLNKRYYYKVVAIYANGTLSGLSNAQSKVYNDN